MRTLLAFQISIATCFALSATAGQVVIDLPELIGHYEDGDNERMIDIAVDVDPAEIESVSLRVAGQGITGALMCSGDEEPSVWPLSINAEGDEPGTHSLWFIDQWVGDDQGPETPVSYDETYGFQAFRSPKWDFLAEGPLQLRFYVSGPPYIGICSPTAIPQADVESAQLVIETSTNVPAPATSWSRIKSLYHAPQRKITPSRRRSPSRPSSRDARTGAGRPRPEFERATWPPGALRP